MRNAWLHRLPVMYMYVTGTTDTLCEVTDNPQPTEKEIQFILHEIKNYLNPDVNGKLSSEDSLE